MSKTIITGGLGFVGKHVVDRLMKDLEVIVVDLPQKDVPDKFCSLPIEEADVTDRRALIDVFKHYGPVENVVHLAALADFNQAEKNPSLASRINIEGTLNAIEATKAVGAKRFIFMSSAAVYGIPESDIITENHPTKPTNNYGRSKLAAEMALLMHNDLDKIILRGANIYGPGQETHFIPLFLNRIIANESPVLNNNGDVVRDLVYVTDVAEAIFRALTVGPHHSVYNLGTEKGVTIKEVWELVAEAAHQKGYDIPSAKSGELGKGEVLRNVLSGDLARESLGWQPTVTLRQGIYKTVEAYLPERTAKQPCIVK